MVYIVLTIWGQNVNEPSHPALRVGLRVLKFVFVIPSVKTAVMFIQARIYSECILAHTHIEIMQTRLATTKTTTEHSWGREPQKPPSGFSLAGMISPLHVNALSLSLSLSLAKPYYTRWTPRNDDIIGKNEHNSCRHVVSHSALNCSQQIFRFAIIFDIKINQFQLIHILLRLLLRKTNTPSGYIKINQIVFCFSCQIKREKSNPFLYKSPITNQPTTHSRSTHFIRVSVYNPKFSQFISG